ncbi:MAG: hypothetical protein RIT24_245 [Planctomycetota bacterium]|jgi:uncharacterized protein HemX
MSDSRPPCDVDSGDRIQVTASTAEELHDCTIPAGVVFSLAYDEDKLMPAPTPDPAPQPTKPPAAPALSIDQSSERSTEQSSEQSTAGTEVADPAVPDLSQVAELAGGNPIVGVILALIVVGGGAAGWKFWTQLADQRHEQAMKRLELEAQAQGMAGTQPPACQAATAELRRELAAIDARIQRIDRNVRSFSSSIDTFDEKELEKRLLKKIDEKIKARASKP